MMAFVEGVGAGVEHESEAVSMMATQSRPNREWETTMSPTLDAAEFMSLSLDQRVAKCRAMAAEAERFAATAEDHMRDAYLDLATKWSELGDEMASISRS